MKKKSIKTDSSFDIIVLAYRDFGDHCLLHSYVQPKYFN